MEISENKIYVRLIQGVKLKWFEIDDTYNEKYLYKVKCISFLTAQLSECLQEITTEESNGKQVCLFTTGGIQRRNFNGLSHVIDLAEICFSVNKYL